MKFSDLKRRLRNRGSRRIQDHKAYNELIKGLKKFTKLPDWQLTFDFGDEFNEQEPIAGTTNERGETLLPSKVNPQVNRWQKSDPVAAPIEEPESLFKEPQSFDEFMQIWKANIPESDANFSKPRHQPTFEEYLISNAKSVENELINNKWRLDEARDARQRAIERGLSPHIIKEATEDVNRYENALARGYDTHWEMNYLGTIAKAANMGQEIPPEVVESYNRIAKELTARHPNHPVEDIQSIIKQNNNEADIDIREIFSDSEPEPKPITTPEDEEIRKKEEFYKQTINAFAEDLTKAILKDELKYAEENGRTPTPEQIKEFIEKNTERNRQMFVKRLEDIKTKNFQGLWSALDPNNKHSRRFFEAITGHKLPKTITETTKFLMDFTSHKPPAPEKKKNKVQQVYEKQSEKFLNNKREYFDPNDPERKDAKQGTNREYVEDHLRAGYIPMIRKYYDSVVSFPWEPRKRIERKYVDDMDPAKIQGLIKVAGVTIQEETVLYHPEQKIPREIPKTMYKYATKLVEEGYPGDINKVPDQEIQKPIEQELFDNAEENSKDNRRFTAVIPHHLRGEAEKAKAEGKELVAHSTTMDGIFYLLNPQHYTGNWKDYLSTSTIGCPEYASKGANTVYLAVKGEVQEYNPGDIGRHGLSARNTGYDEIELTNFEPVAFLVPKDKTNQISDYDEYITNIYLINEVLSNNENRRYNIEFEDDIPSYEITHLLWGIDTAVSSYLEKHPDESIAEWIDSGRVPESIYRNVKSYVRVDKQIKELLNKHG